MWIRRPGKIPVKNIIATSIKEYLPSLLRVLFTLFKEKKEGHFVVLEKEDLWLQDLMKKQVGAGRPKVTVKPEPSGFQVWPREVEEVITAHPAVAEVSVAGIPDAKQGEAVKAWVLLKAGQSATAEEIQAWCREKLVAYKMPRFVEFRDELPKTMVGKVLKRVLVEEEKKKAGK
jgi:hypothetical protein